MGVEEDGGGDWSVILASNGTDGTKAGPRSVGQNLAHIALKKSQQKGPFGQSQQKGPFGRHGLDNTSQRVGSSLHPLSITLFNTRLNCESHLLSQRRDV